MNKQTRREFLKVLGMTAGSLIVPSSLFGQRRAARRPNVILIFTDDQGTIDVNCYGSKDLYTSNLDRLAKEGTRFTQFYVGAPVCSPSRAALMTGRYPQNAGVPGNVSSQPGHAGMPTEQVTIAEMMKSAGYVTGHVGKWHLGYTPETMPNEQGYDYSFGHMGGCIDNYSHFFYWSGPNRHDLWRNGQEVWRDGEFFGELMVDECKKFIDKNKRKPFFLYWAINMPHYPLQGTEKWRKKYQHLDAPRRMYAAFISTMDEMVGRVVDGMSIVSVIESPDAPSPHKALHWETSRGKHWAVREGDWKLVHNGPATDYKGRKLPKAENFLSNIAEDATETKNLAKSNPDIVKRLTNLHENWLRQAQKK